MLSPATNNNSQEVKPLSASAERVRLSRKRRAQGLRCVTVEIRDSEILSLINHGLLSRDRREDRYAIARVLHALFERVLSAHSV